MIKTTLRDGRGSGFGAQVTERGHALCTTTIPPDPRDIDFKILNLRHFETGFLRDSSNSKDLTINGAATPTEFGIYSQQDRHLWITKLIITLHSSGMKLDSNEIRNFGAVGTPLATGFSLELRTAGETFDLVGTGVTEISQFYRNMDEVIGVTDGISAGVDLLVTKKSFSDLPLALQSRSDDQLVLTIADDLTSLALFEIEWEGYHVNDSEENH